MDDEKQPGKIPPPTEPDGALEQNPTVDEFFTRLNYDMRRPKPGQESIGAALEAIQRLALEMDAEDSAGMGVPVETARSRMCLACGAANPEINKFCASCGVPIEDIPAPSVETSPSQLQRAEPREPQFQPPLPPGPHHYHHHYHHHYFAPGNGAGEIASERGPVPSAQREGGKIRGTINAPSSGRNEAAVRKLTQDWALACNNKHLNDVVELYAPDAVVLRSNLLPIRGTAAIREFFFSALESGFGEVEMESLRVEMFGDVAYEIGRCKMLVPVAMGKRREERGKYLIMSIRQNAEWKLVADCWSSDLSLTAAPDAASSKPAPGGGNVPRSSPPRK